MVTEPLRDQKRVARLSVWDLVVRSRTSKQVAIACWWRMAPANSSSELLMVPWGLMWDTKFFVIAGGNWWRQKMGTGWMAGLSRRKLSLRRLWRG